MSRTVYSATESLSAEDYLSLKGSSGTKFEFIGGKVFAKAGVSFAHSQIVSNVFISIGSSLYDKPCAIYGSDLMISSKSETAWVHPDLTVICQGPQFLEDQKNAVTNPALVLEVYSPNTLDYVYGKKFSLYRNISSLKECLFVSSTEVFVERCVKETSGAWRLNLYKNLNDSFNIESIGYTVSLAEVYREVAFEDGEA